MEGPGLSEPQTVYDTYGFNLHKELECLDRIPQKN